MNRPLAIMALFGLCLTSCSSSESAQQEVNTDESYGIVGFEDGSFIVQQFTLQSSESGKLNVGCYYDEKANCQCIGKGDTSDSSGKPIDLISTSLIAVIDAKHASDCDMQAVVVFGIKFDAPTLNTDDLCYYGNASKTVYVYKGKEISKDEAFAIMDKAREDYLLKFKERKAKAVDEFAKRNPGLLTQKQIDEGKESFEGFKVHLGVCKYNRFIESNKDYLEYVEIADYYRSGDAESNCHAQSITPAARASFPPCPINHARGAGVFSPSPFMERGGQARGEVKGYGMMSMVLLSLAQPSRWHNRVPFSYRSRCRPISNRHRNRRVAPDIDCCGSGRWPL